MISNSSCRYFTHEYVFDYINITFNYCTILSSHFHLSFNDLSQNPNKKNIVYIWNWLNVAGVYPIYIGMNVYKFNSWKHSSRHTFIRLSYVCECVRSSIRRWHPDDVAADCWNCGAHMWPGHCFHVYYVVHIFNHVVPVPMGRMENKREGVWRGVLIITALFSTILTFHLCPREFRLSSKTVLVPLCKVISVKVYVSVWVCVCVCVVNTWKQNLLISRLAQTIFPKTFLKTRITNYGWILRIVWTSTFDLTDLNGLYL